jgi:hypothetical protein
MRAASFLGVVALGAALVGCNSVLGIDPASLAPDASDDGPVMTNDDPLTCANYCKVVSRNCTGEYVEYLPTAGDGGANDPCMFLCTNYLIRNPGTYAPPNGPEPMATPGQPATLACRLWHAHAAGTMPQSIHCRHAGPLGSEACGDPCAAFCSLDFSYCVDDNAVPTYSSQSQCQAACLGAGSPDAAVDAGFVYDNMEGDLVDKSMNQINGGNTLNCRLWHLETSIQENMPSMHCWHTASPSENPGGGPGGPCSQ